METKEMNVLSLFDGISCAQIALERAGKKVANYYAAEIDKFAIKVTMANYPTTIQLGDVTKINASDLPRIDLLVGGSPCQGFSFAGKQLNFEDPRSKLFFEYVRILNEIRAVNPDVRFLLENVKMKKEYQDVISEALGVQPILINSALVSAQNRNRLYWHNLGHIEQLEDKRILLKDILEENPDEKYNISDKVLSRLNVDNVGYVGYVGFKRIGKDSEKSATLLARDYKGMCNQGLNVVKINKEGNLKRDQEKASCITGGGHSGGNHSDMDLLVERKVNQLNQSREFGNQPSQQNRVYDTDGVSPVLLAQMSSGTHAILNETRIRRLTPIECERLQCCPDNYTSAISDSQRYKALGNGFTVDVIAHIFKNL